MRISEIALEEKDQYNSLVANHPIGHIFQSWEWGELKSRSGWVARRFLIKNADIPCGAFSVLVRKTPVLKRCIFYIPCGPIIDFEDNQMLTSFVDHIKNLAKESGAIFVKIDPAITEDHVTVRRNLETSGFSRVKEGEFEGIQPRSVMHLDISSDLETVLKGMKPKWRYNIQLAERKGVRVRMGSKADLKPFYEILIKTGKRDKFLVRDYKYFENLFNILMDKNMGRLFVAEYEGRIISGTIAFVFGKKCWYVYGASGNEYRNLMPNHALQWAMIKWAKEMGCPIYDMRGVPSDQSENHPLYGLVRFKEGFGAKLVNYIGEYEMRFSPALAWGYRYGFPIYTKTRKMLRG